MSGLHCAQRNMAGFCVAWHGMAVRVARLLTEDHVIDVVLHDA